MENNANQLNQNLCKKNCGFFGSSAFDGYCSKCYKDHVKRQNSGTAAGVLQSNLNSSSTNILTSTSSSTTTTTDIPNTIDSTTISNNEPIAIDNETPQQPQVVLPDNAIEIDNQPTVSFTIQEQEPQVQEQQTEQQQQLLQAQADEQSSSSQDMSPVASSGDLTSSNDKKKKTRCMVDTCRRKVGLTGFDCRCGGIYCWEHRYSDKHSCNFDYKEHGQDQIRKNNPIVVGEKIQKL